MVGPLAAVARDLRDAAAAASARGATSVTALADLLGDIGPPSLWDPRRLWSGAPAAADATNPDSTVAESEERLRLAIDATGLAVFDFRLAEGEIMWSERVRRLIGVEPDEPITPEMAKAVVHPDDLPGLMAAFTRALDPGGSREWDHDHRIRRRDGEIRWIRNRGRMFFAERDGRPVGVRCIGGALDLTDRRRTEDALRASEERFRVLCAAVPVAIYHTDPAGRPIYRNDRWDRLLGGGDGAAVNGADRARPFWPDHVVPEDRESVIAECARAVRERTSWVQEFRFRRFDGTVRWARDLGAPIRDPDGGVVSYVGAIEDITEQKQAVAAEHARVEEQLRRSERLAALGTLAAGIAHEINNPLASVLSTLELLRGGDDDAARTMRGELDALIQEVQRCGQIVRNVLKFARDQRTARQPHDVNEVVQHVRDLARELAAGAVVRLELAPALPPVVIDPTELSQVLMNLLRNAFDAGSARVQVRTAPGAGGVTIEVTDDGRGVAAADVAHVFDPFFTTRRDRGGTGLGLSIVHGIVADHGGTIDLRAAPGGGTTFTIELPSVATAARN